MAQTKRINEKQAWWWATFIYFVALCGLLLVLVSRCKGL